MDLTVLAAHPAFIRQRNEPYLPLFSQPKLVLIYRPRRDGRLSWPWVAGWLHTEISVRHRELNPETVAHRVLDSLQAEGFKNTGLA